MSQVNVEFLFDTALTISTVGITLRLLYLKINRKAYLVKHDYHPGMAEYESISKATRPIVLVISILATVLIVSRLIYVVHNILAQHNPDNTFILIFVPVAAILLGAFGCLVSYKLYGTERPKALKSRK